MAACEDVAERSRAVAGSAALVRASIAAVPVLVHLLRWLAVAILCVASLPALAQAPTLVGEWDWGAGGGIVEIAADGSGHDARGNTLSWTLADAAQSTYALVWSHGFTDTAILSADGNSVEVVNNVGFRFTAKRRGLLRSMADDLPGTWTWSMGAGAVVIRPDGTGQDGRGNTMKWTLKDAATRTYVLSWSHGYTDTATLSPDGRRLDVINNSGAHFFATRGPVEVAGPLDLNGSWGSNLLHIWQDGADVLVTASWKRDDGKYVIWRGEGTLAGHTLTLEIQYSPMAHGPQPAWHGKMTVSADGNRIDAVYTTAAGSSDHRVYARDR